MLLSKTNSDDAVMAAIKFRDGIMKYVPNVEDITLMIREVEQWWDEVGSNNFKCAFLTGDGNKFRFEIFDKVDEYNEIGGDIVFGFNMEFIEKFKGKNIRLEAALSPIRYMDYLEETKPDFIAQVVEFGEKIFK